LSQWDDLNARQQAYLKAVYVCDQTQERAEKSRAAQDHSSQPADQWRWISYNGSNTRLLGTIKEMGYWGRGAGSTFEALERRGLVHCRYGRVALGKSPLFVQITRAGRKKVREALGLEAPKSLPPGTLREWHWRALVHAYQAGERGVQEWPRGIGHMTVSRLRAYRLNGQGCPLIGWVEVPLRRLPSQDGCQ